MQLEIKAGVEQHSENHDVTAELSQSSANKSATKGNIASLLTLASCAVLAQSATAASGGSDDGSPKWKPQIAVMNYDEDDRVEVKQGMFKLQRVTDDRTFSIKVDYDSVSGPSESGAAPQPFQQSFTSPSGRSDILVDSGELPYYTIASHQRRAISISDSVNLSSKNSVSYGARYTKEPTYIGRGINASFSRYTKGKNTQYTFGASYESADVMPYGGAVEGGATVALRSDYADEDSFNEAWQALRPETKVGKTAREFVAGLTQVINKDMVVQLNYSYSEVDGYLNDAQKIVSAIDVDGISQFHIHENRPNERRRQSLFVDSKLAVTSNSVIDMSYRYFWDDWDISSHTISAGYQFEFGKKFKIEPQVRWYSQDAASFFRHSVFTDGSGNAEIPEYLSADYRLAETTNITLGLNLDFYLSGDRVVSARLAHYRINPEEDGSTKRGYIANVDTLPEIEATVFSLSYAFK